MDSCTRSDNGLCHDPHYCTPTGRCWYDDKARAFADTMMKGTSEKAERWEKGPVCARCKYSDFVPAELPMGQLRPPTPEMDLRIVEEKFRITVCPVIRRRITATSGKDCPQFELDPRKAS